MKIELGNMIITDDEVLVVTSVKESTGTFRVFPTEEAAKVFIDKFMKLGSVH